MRRSAQKLKSSNIVRSEKVHFLQHRNHEKFVGHLSVCGGGDLTFLNDSSSHSLSDLPYKNNSAAVFTDFYNSAVVLELLGTHNQSIEAKPSIRHS